MKKKPTPLFIVSACILYFAAFFLPYIADSSFSFYAFDFLKRFILLLVPTATLALLLPSALAKADRKLFFPCVLLSLPILFYTFFSFYLDVYEYVYSFLFALLLSLFLSLLCVFSMGLVVYLAILLLRKILSRYEKKHTLADGYSPFDFASRIPFAVGMANMTYVLMTLAVEIVNAVIFLCRYYASYSLSEIIYMGVTFILIFVFFFPIQFLAVTLSKKGVKA